MDNAVEKVELIMRLRAEGVRDTQVLEAIEKVPRELFVSEAYRDQSYEDHALPIECGQTISQPFVVGYMTAKLSPNERSKVLEVGTGSGYQAGVLSYLCRRVYTIERHRKLANLAKERFEKLGRRNVTGMVGDGMKGWPAQAPFDRIIVTACAKARVPKALLEQLAVGGRMIIPVELPGGRQELQLITRSEDGFERETLLPVRFVPLVEGIARTE